MTAILLVVPFFIWKTSNPSRLHVYHNCLAGYEHRSNQGSDLHLELVDAYGAITEFFCVGNQANKPQEMLFSRLGTNTTVLDKVASLEVRSSVNPRVAICHFKIGNYSTRLVTNAVQSNYFNPVKRQLNPAKFCQVPFEQLTFRRHDFFCKLTLTPVSHDIKVR